MMPMRIAKEQSQSWLRRVLTKKGGLAVSAPVVAASEVLLDTAAQVVGRTRPSSSVQTRVLSGSAILLLSTVVVAITNLLYNFVIARGLGAAGFGHASAVYTLLMLLSALTLSFQLLSSKLIARSPSFAIQAGIYRFLHRRAWLVGVAASACLFSASPLISRYLNLPTRHYVDMLAGGIIFFIPLGVRRGFMQGMCDFSKLGGNLVVEVIVKLVGAALLIDAGLGVSGVVGAITASIVIAYLLGLPRQKVRVPAGTPVPATLREGIQTSAFFAGQVVINNLDILLVEHFFSATEAGIYAAVALVGRLVYSLCWSVVNGMFPLSARTHAHDGDGRTVLNTAVLLVVLIASVFTLAVWLTPASLWHLALGSGFPARAATDYSSLLVLYATTTGIYSLSVVLMSYEISRKIGNVTWMQLGISAAIVIGIYLFHGTLREVIAVQLVLMVVLLLMVSLPFLRSQLRGRDGHPQILVPNSSAFRRIRRVHEGEVIAEYLKSEFFQPEFDAYREQFRNVVCTPDLANDQENRLRRALLYVRRGRLWQELPPDTEWWELKLEPADLCKIRVFPRKHWCHFAKPNFYFSDVMDRIQPWMRTKTRDPFATKLRSLNSALANSETRTTVLLIGVDDESPLTILDGNHRMAAAGLISPNNVYERFRFVCGFSSRMMECCWYQTDFFSLWRYARNYVAFVMDDHNIIIRQALQSRM